MKTVLSLIKAIGWLAAAPFVLAFMLVVVAVGMEKGRFLNP